MFRHLAGINPDEQNPGYKHFTIRPRPTTGLDWAKGSYESIRGKIESQWRREGNTFHLEVLIPANTTATVYIPTRDLESVREGRNPLERVSTVRVSGLEDGVAVLEVGSGRYHFVAGSPGRQE